MNYVDQPAAAIDPDMRSAVTSAITTCTLANLDITP
jgi:hypothetical protein